MWSLSLFLSLPPPACMHAHVPSSAAQAGARHARARRRDGGAQGHAAARVAGEPARGGGGGAGRDHAPDRHAVPQDAGQGGRDAQRRAARAHAQALGGHDGVLPRRARGARRERGPAGARRADAQPALQGRAEGAWRGAERGCMAGACGGSYRIHRMLRLHHHHHHHPDTRLCMSLCPGARLH